MTARALRRARGPLALHAAAGALAVAWGLRLPCGSDECLGPLFAGTAAGVWLLAVPLVVLAAARQRALALAAALVWVPVAWLTTLALFVTFPSLAGA